MMQAAGLDFQQNFFSLFGLPVRYQLENTLLDKHYHTLAAQVHPDKFSHLSEAERRVSMQWATRVNEAYQTLSNSAERARYLLSLHGIETQEETNTAMPTDFLMQQMEWREAIEEAQQAQDSALLVALETRLQHEVHELEARLALEIDGEKNYPAAASNVRKLKFLEKLSDEISSAFDELDS